MRERTEPPKAASRPVRVTPPHAKRYRCHRARLVRSTPLARLARENTGCAWLLVRVLREMSMGQPIDSQLGRICYK